MKKNIFGRKFKRDANERKALFKNLLTSLVLEERIKTTPAKAKAIKAAADKLVTKAKKALPGGGEAMRSLAPDVNHNAVVKLVGDIAPRFTTRQGGYTRIIKVGRRIADNSPQVIMEWVEKKVIVVKEEAAKGAKAKKAAPKKETKKAEVKVDVKKVEKETKQKEEKKDKRIAAKKR